MRFFIRQNVQCIEPNVTIGLRNNSQINVCILVSIWTEASSFIELCAIHVRTVTERGILALHRPPTLLISKMPVEAGERTVL